MKNSKTKKLATIGVLTAISTILFFIKIPLAFIAPPFYELDLSNVVSLIGAFALGPVSGVIIELLKNLINLVIDGSITGGIGELSNFLTACAFVIPASLVYKYHKNKTSAIIGLLAGVLVMTIFGYFSNLYIMIPAYSTALHLPLEDIVKMGTTIHSSIDSVSDLVFLCVVPFNLIKGVIISLVTFLLYKRISKAIK